MCADDRVHRRPRILFRSATSTSRSSKSSVDVSLVAHIFDVAHDLQVTPAERLLEPSLVGRARGARSKPMLAPRLELSADGRVLTAEWGATEDSARSPVDPVSHSLRDGVRPPARSRSTP